MAPDRATSLPDPTGAVWSGSCYKFQEAIDLPSSLPHVARMSQSMEDSCPPTTCELVLVLPYS